MSDVDPRLIAAMREQLTRRPAGARRIGWKYGDGSSERIGDEIAVGHLTSATTLEDGATYVGGGADLHADVELAVELDSDLAIGGYAVALELVDLADRNGPEAVVARNDFHRAVAFGRFEARRPRTLEAALVVNGSRRDSSTVVADASERVEAVGRVLHAVGEKLRAGDRIITGLVVQVPVGAGDEVVGEMGELGRVMLRVA